LLALSAVLPPLGSSGCQSSDSAGSCSPDPVLILFFFALYLVALGQGGFRPCVQAFGADQFDAQDPEERKAKSSFFNWWHFFMNAGLIAVLPALNYIQDNINWVLGFGIPCLILAGALAIFLLGTRTYRYSIRWEEEKHAFLRVGRVFVATFRNWRITTAVAFEEETHRAQPQQSSGQFK